MREIPPEPRPTSQSSTWHKLETPGSKKVAALRQFSGYQATKTVLVPSESPQEMHTQSEMPQPPSSSGSNNTPDNNPPPPQQPSGIDRRQAFAREKYRSVEFPKKQSLKK